MSPHRHATGPRGKPAVPTVSLEHAVVPCANIGITHGTTNALIGILIAAVVVFATLTFIFALEGSIMAQGLQLGLHVPLCGWATPSPA